MNTCEKLLEMRGMLRREILEYFISLGAKSEDFVNYAGDGWSVEIQPENQVCFGPIKIPATVVIFRSDEETLSSIIYSFRLRFLSAGG